MTRNQDPRRRRTEQLAVSFPDGPGLSGERLAAFVARGRELAERAGLDFDDDAWEVSRLLKPRRGLVQVTSRYSLHFTSVTGGQEGRRPWPKSMADIAKAACVQLLGRTTMTPLIVRCDAMRALAACMGERPVTSCTIIDLDAAAAELRRRYSFKAAELRLMQLRGLVLLLKHAGVMRADLANWQPKPAVEAGAELPRPTRLPADGLSKAVARSFAIAVEPDDVLVASACTLMQIVPARVSAVIDLEENCWNECLEGGARRLLIRFNSDKGSPPCTKWVPREMADVAELAFRRIQDVTAEARAIKRWYDAHPDRLYLPPRLAHLRQEDWLTLDEASSVLGLQPGYIVDSACKGRLDLKIHRGGGPARVGYTEVERIVLGRLEEMMRLAGGRRCHPLMLLKWRSRTVQTVSECMFKPISQKAFNRSLAPYRGQPGLFQRLGIDPSGTLRGNTHCWRHSLTTAAVRGGLSLNDLGDWFGRLEPGSACHYDHSSDADFRDVLAGVPVTFLSASTAGEDRQPRKGRRR